ncbi:MAG: carboxypeptidase-like regulatory domain-containing protein, partial [Anaerolineae bacterium]
MMKRKRFFWPVLLATAVLIIFPFAWRRRAVSGVVLDVNGRPLAHAIVRIKTTDVASETDADGRFSLPLPASTFKTHITAWQDGYYVSGREVWPWNREAEIRLAAYAAPDNAEYAWIAPVVDGRSPTAEWFTQTGLSLAAKISFNRTFLPLSTRMTLGCRDCHGRPIYDQWASSGHALAADNPRFLTMYNGTDVAGNQSPPTQKGYNRDYGSFPLRPDPNQPYYGPGYKLDFPGTAGNCAACHLPAAASEQPYGVDPNQTTGADAQGTH